MGKLIAFMMKIITYLTVFYDRMMVSMTAKVLHSMPQYGLPGSSAVKVPYTFGLLRKILFSEKEFELCANL